MSWGKTGESLLVRDNVGDPIMSWPLWEDKKEKASRLLSFLFHFLHHPHPHPNNHCNYQPVSFDNFESLSWKPQWTKNEMKIHCPSLSCFVKATNCQPNISFVSSILFTQRKSLSLFYFLCRLHWRAISLTMNRASEGLSPNSFGFFGFLSFFYGRTLFRCVLYFPRNKYKDAWYCRH